MASCPVFVKNPLRIVLLEDSALDARLVEQELKHAGISFSLTRIQTEAELYRELEPQPPDLVLSDHGLPSFDGFTALDIVRKKCPDLPFIFVSGSNDQGMVTDMYERGATDYVYKHDIQDLHGVVQRALEPQPEEAGSVESPTSSSQRELELGLAATAPTDLHIGQPAGHLVFCPRCMQARDHMGQVVQLETCLANFSEIVVIREVCATCARF